MIYRELTYFCTAIMFFTRIPIPVKLEYSEEIMNQSQKYFPLVGAIVGGIGCFVYFVSQLFFSTEISLVISMISTVLLTGAFHEDGFTDVCDSFGGGYGKEQIMTIMKDSRIGAYGVIGIILILLLKFLALNQIAYSSGTLIYAVILNGHITSRFQAGTMIFTDLYVTDIDKSKSKPLANKKLSYGAFFFTLLTTLIPYFLFKNWLFLLIIPLSHIGKLYLSWYFKKHIGGYTGDCLGTVQQICEVLFYLIVIILWKFM